MARLAGALLVALGLALGTAAPARAHPHAWIDLAVEVVFDAEGRVVALRQTWLFDDFYSAYATEGFKRDRAGNPDPAALAQLVATHLTNLADHGYFTRVTTDAGVVALGVPGEASARMRGRRLETRFTLPLTEPVAPTGGGITYSIYDPTYYIDLLHARDPGAIRLADAPAACRQRLVAPNPSFEAVSLAAAADRTQSLGEGIGALFAESVVIACDGAN